MCICMAMKELLCNDLILSGKSFDYYINLNSAALSTDEIRF